MEAGSDDSQSGAMGAVAVLGGEASRPVAEWLRLAGLTVLDGEPAPKQVDAGLAGRYGFGVASVRAGVLGDLRLVAQWMRAATMGQVPEAVVWTDADKAPRDAFRAAVEPAADSVEEVLANHAAHLVAARRVIGQARLVVLPLRAVDVVECGGMLLPAPPAGMKPAKGRKAKPTPLTEAVALSAMDEVLSLLGRNVAVRLLCPAGPEGANLRQIASGLAARHPGVVLHDALVDDVVARMQGADGVARFGPLLARMIGAADVLEALAGLATGVGTAGTAPVAADPAKDKEAKRSRREARAKRKAKSGKVEARVVCEDELLEAFS